MVDQKQEHTRRSQSGHKKVTELNVRKSAQRVRTDTGRFHRWDDQLNSESVNECSQIVSTVVATSSHLVSKEVSATRAQKDVTETMPLFRTLQKFPNRSKKLPANLRQELRQSCGQPISRLLNRSTAGYDAHKMN